jgi:hypothetical protein
MEVSCRSEEVVEDSRMVAVVREESPADFLHGHAQCELSRGIRCPALKVTDMRRKSNRSFDT